MDDRNIGRKIAQLRKEQGLSSTELAQRAGLSQPQISRLENGKQGFRSETLARIAAALDVPIGFFFEDDAVRIRGTKQRTRKRRRDLGGDLDDDLRSLYGALVVTPGYQQMIRRLVAAMAKEDCDARTLRRLVDRVAAMSNEERTRLLNRLTSR